MISRKMVRRAATVLSAPFFVILYFNIENLAARLGWADILADAVAPERGDSPLLSFIQHPLAIAISIFGIGLATGLWIDQLLLKRERRAEPAPSPMLPAREEITLFGQNALSQLAYAAGADFTFAYDIAIVSVEGPLRDFCAKFDLEAPELRNGGVKSGALRAMRFLMEVLPPLQSGDIDEARTRARAQVAKLNAMDGDQLRALMELPSADGPVPPPAAQIKAVSASSNVKSDVPYYEYPKAVLQVDNFHISRSALHDGQLEKVDGHILIKSHCYTTLHKCEVRAVSLGQHGVEESLHSCLFAGYANNRQETGFFLLPAGQTKQFPLVVRDLKDVVSKPPFLLRFAGMKRPLSENSTYVLTLDLRSEAVDVTRAKIQIETRTGADFSLTLLDQAVMPR